MNVNLTRIASVLMIVVATWTNASDVKADGLWRRPADNQFVADDPTGYEMDVFKIMTDSSVEYIHTPQYQWVGTYSDPATYQTIYEFHLDTSLYAPSGDVDYMYGNIYRKMPGGTRVYSGYVEFTPEP